MNQQAKELLREALNQIKQEPSKWQQSVWHSRCGTSHCIIGWIDCLIGIPKGHYVSRRNGCVLYNDVQQYLDLDDDNYDLLTGANNSLKFLECAVAALCDDKNINGYYDEDKNMIDIEKQSAELLTVFDRIQAVNSLIIDGQYAYKFNRVLEIHASLFDRFCPFKIGDRVELIKAPEISTSVAWGWLGAKHYLVPGAIATVLSLDYRQDLFCFGLLFDDDSWVDRSGNIHLKGPDNRSTLFFSEDFLSPLSAEIIATSASTPPD